MLPVHLARQTNGRCVFATFLAYSQRHTSIKVYLSVVRSSHIDLSFRDALTNCSRLKRVVQGIKRVQGSVSAERLPTTDHILAIIFQSLDVSCHDQCMFWAACALAYFGFLKFSPALHLVVGAVAVDSSNHPLCLRVRIKTSKTDPFRKGCLVHIGRAKPPLCAVDTILAYPARRGNAPGPLF